MSGVPAGEEGDMLGDEAANICGGRAALSVGDDIWVLELTNEWARSECTQNGERVPPFRLR